MARHHRRWSPLAARLHDSWCCEVSGWFSNSFSDTLLNHLDVFWTERLQDFHRASRHHHLWSDSLFSDVCWALLPGRSFGRVQGPDIRIWPVPWQIKFHSSSPLVPWLCGRCFVVLWNPVCWGFRNPWRTGCFREALCSKCAAYQQDSLLITCHQ